MTNESYDSNKLHDILDFIGLNKNEREIYIILATKKPLTAMEISSYTKIYRTNIYDALKKLISRGLVSEIHTHTGRQFKATGTTIITDYIREKRKEFDIILPHLNNMIQSEAIEENNIQVSQGMLAARSELQKTLDLREPIFVYGASNEAINTFGEGFLKEYHKERIKQKIQMNHIYSKSAMKRILYLNKIKFTEAKYLPEKYDTVASTCICGNRVLIFIFAKPILTIRIDNDLIANAYRNYFDILWKKAAEALK